MKTLGFDSKQMADEKDMHLNPLKIHLCPCIISILISHFVDKQLSQLPRIDFATRQIGIVMIGDNVSWQLNWHLVNWHLVGNELTR